MPRLKLTSGKLENAYSCLIVLSLPLVTVIAHLVVLTCRNF